MTKNISIYHQIDISQTELFDSLIFYHRLFINLSNILLGLKPASKRINTGPAIINFNPYNTEIFLYKPWRPKVFFSI